MTEKLISWDAVTCVSSALLVGRLDEEGNRGEEKQQEEEEYDENKKKL